MLEYRPRITDKVLELKLGAFGAVLINGPKGCGKTTSAKQKAKSYLEFQNEDERERLIKTAEISPSLLLEGDKPRLFDEWQDAPKLWGAIRKNVDDTGLKGQYILTGSSSREVDSPHSGTLRISRMQMYPMSLFESGESNGKVSLLSLFENPASFEGVKSSLSIEELIFALCRGGWPGSLLGATDEMKLEIAKDLVRQTYSIDISRIDNKKKKPKLANAILKSYSRNICTLTQYNTILKDVNGDTEISLPSLYEYIDALEALYIIDDIDAWCPQIRSRSNLRSSKKRNFIEPSIAVASLGLSPKYFYTDLQTFGFLFESLCIRDLKVYSSALNGNISYYHDRYGLEADGVLHLEDGRYALLEFKLGSDEIEKGAKHLNEIETLIIKHNKGDEAKIPFPTFKAVITGGQYGYKREDGVFVIPIGTLRD